ncbi:MAG TPA: hypothetical protein VFQ85_10485 [Mycobacteriales bacterium]|nr:hypothetical protein [Mycobacteriales bacterium]
MTRRLSARLAAALSFAAAVVLLATPAPGVPAAAPFRVPGPGEIVLPAGRGLPIAEHEPEAQVDASIADLPAADNQHAYALQALGLPAVRPDIKWTNVGPFGQDDPMDSPSGNIRFARNAGMGAAIEVDPADPSGNSIYMGNMGGLWHSTDAGDHWTSLSDGKLTRGAVGAIAVDPKQPKNVYVGTGIAYLTTSGDAPGSGIWVSHDGGKSFHRPAKNIRGYAVNDLLVTDDGVLAATTNGLYASTDAGATFTRVVLPSNAAHDGEAKGAYANWISALAVSPLNPKEVIAAVGLGVGKLPGPDGKPLSPGNGLYKSSTGVAGPFEYMTSTSQLTHQGASSDPIGRIMLSYVKDPSGDSAVLWAILSDAGLANGQNPGGDAGDLVADTTGQNVNQTATEFNGLYRSDDGGDNWQVKATWDTLQATAINSGLGVYPALGYGIGVQASYNLWVDADPRDPDQVYFGLEEVYQSVAGTESGPTPGEFEIIQRYWDVCGSTTYLENLYGGITCPDQTPYYGGVSTHPDQHVGRAVQVGANTVRLYTGNDGGYFREDSHALTDGRNAFDNDSWTAMNTLPSVQPWKIARKPDGEFLTALQDNGGGYFAPGKASTLISSGDGVNAVATPNPDVWYLSAQGAILYVTTDHGKTIRAIPSGAAGLSFLSPVQIDPTDENHLMVAGNEIMETTKGPNTMSTIDPVLYTVIQTDWSSTFTAGTNSDTGSAWGAQGITIRGADAYVGMCGLCRATLGDPTKVASTIATNVQDGCTPAKASQECWHLAQGIGLPHNGIWNLVMDPVDRKTVYVVLNNNSQVGYDEKVGGGQRVMVSHDAGDHFTDITGKLPHSQARDVVVRAGRLIVAGDHGVFIGTPDGKSWSRLGGGLPPVRVYDLDLDSTGRYLTASVYGRGVWTFDFGAKAPSSSGPGPKGEPEKPRTVTSGRGSGIPATGANAAAGMVAAALGVLALGAGRARRRTAA